MKRITFCILFLSLVVVCASLVAAQQTRPRRVYDGATSAPPDNSRVPTRAPVLGGANRTPGSTNNQTAEPVNDGPEEVESGDVIRVNTTLVTLPVSVMDRDGRYIPNLRKEEFRLWEDGVEQSVAFFSSVDKPFSVVLMIDTSRSTQFRLEDIQDAAITFVRQLRPDDKVMVVSFDDRLRVLCEFTSDRYRLQEAIRETEPGNGTRLYDAVDMVINQRLNDVSGRKAIVLFTDGVDTTSRHASYASNIRDAEELDALVYPVQYDTYQDQGGVFGGGGGGWPGSNSDVLGQILGGILNGGHRRGGVGTSRRDYERANTYLQEMAQRTGARRYQADASGNLASVFAQVADELRKQYTLGYYPKNSAQAGQRRQVRVTVNRPNLAVRTRDSYVFNPNGTNDASAQRSAPVLQKKLWGMDPYRGYYRRN
jgi:VWFA-related protein